MRVAVVDIGSNSTRLLIARLDGDGGLEELDRRSVVTRLGHGVDATGRLGDEPQQRVFSTLDEYARSIDQHRVQRKVAVLTSAVRDSANGAEFARAVRDRYGLDGRTLSGEDEARLTFLGATAARDDGDGPPLLVVDIGGGSTELVVGSGGRVDFHVSTQAGVVRHTERHLASDPPAPAELDALAADARSLFEAAVPVEVRERVGAAVAVAGTATSVAAIDLGDRSLVEGHVVSVERLGEIRATLAAIALQDRCRVPGLDPDRAPTIVAGTILLGQALETFGLDRFESSERDLLWGAALADAP